MIKKVSLEELERVCEFLELDFTRESENVCSIQYPFEDCPTDYFTIINDDIFFGIELAKKVIELKEYEEKIKNLQNEIKLLTKGQ